MNLINLVYDSLKWKKTDEFCATKLGISLDKYKNVKDQIKNIQQVLQDDLDEVLKNMIQKRINEQQNEKEFNEESIRHFEEQLGSALAQQKEKVIEFKENLEQGTAEIKGISFTEPKSPEEIERILKLNTTKWKLSSYWNKEHKGYWLVSAMVTLKKQAELTIEDAEGILAKVFEDKDFTPKTSYPTISNNKALFVYTSDKHIAAYVGENSIYENNYDGLTYQARMKAVLNEIHYHKSIYGKFEDIYLIDLGDKMDGMNGFTTRGGHKLPQNMGDREAFETAITVEKEFYDLVITSDLANHVHVVQNANSNHGGNFDYMVSRALEIYLNAKYPDVETRVLEKFIDHLVYGKHTILLTHGKDEEDMKNGFPIHLNDKTENYLNKYLLKKKIDPDTTVVSLIKGDLHRDTSETAYGFRYRNVLSLFGGSKWISTNFGPNHPGCSFDIIEKDTDRILESKILFKNIAA